jgi:hypothetical protein
MKTTTYHLKVWFITPVLGTIPQWDGVGPCFGGLKERKKDSGAPAEPAPGPVTKEAEAAH